MKSRSLATNSGLAFAGDLASKIGLLLVLVIAARMLPTEELAILVTALAVSGILAVCLDAGSGLAITARRRPRHREPRCAALGARRGQAAGRRARAAAAVAAGAALKAPPSCGSPRPCSPCWERSP